MQDRKDFLFEIGVEEMPSAPLINATKQLGKLVTRKLDETGLAHGDIRVISSPRRLAAVVSDVACATQEINEVKRGPATNIAFGEDGTPTKAAEGFARKFGLAAADLAVRVDDDGREYVFAEKHVDSAPATPILSKLGHDVIAELEWPNYRSQRWGSTHETFVRPVRWVCCLLGSDVVPVTYADVTSSNVTFGHRVLAPGAHEVASPADYEATLERAFVLSADRREQAIREGIARVEAERGGATVETPARIFDEVVNLCEWPTVVVGTFDEEFLQVPHEIICESMLSNQRYFPIRDASGNLTREFVVVSNADPAVSDTVAAGNERVVRARLEDAKFFYEEDLKVGIEALSERLDSVVFQEKLGTVAQKVERMETLALECARAVNLDAREASQAVRAAHLAKADLVSQAVIEFTSQQGVMGGYYAKAAGEDDEVALAIQQHYRPRFAGDELPSGSVGRVVAIADKLDTICGMFAIDEPPTGSSDPFAVRRAAIGTIALLRSLDDCSLAALIDIALTSYEGQGLTFDHDKVAKNVADFFAGRLAAIARDEKVRADTIEAVSAANIIDPSQFLMRAHALEDARTATPEVFDDLATAYARAAHLGDASLGTTVDESLLTEPERVLLDACEQGERAVADALAQGAFSGALGALADLRAPIDRFFEEVLVMDVHTDVRENRLRLLNRFASVFDNVADIGALARKR